MSEADVEPASDGIGKMSRSTENDNGPDSVRDKKTERGSGETMDVNPEPEESVEANGSEGKHEKPNEDIKPASERRLKTNGSATAEYSGPEDVLEEKSEEGNQSNVGEESTEMTREKEDVGLQELEFDNKKLQELPDIISRGENVEQSHDLKIMAIDAMKIPNETERSEAKDGDVPEHVKMLAEDMKKVDDTEDDVTKTENEKVTEASDIFKPEDDRAAKTEDMKASHAEDSEVLESSPKISDVDKSEDAVDEMAKTEDVEMSAGYVTKPEDAEISEVGDAKKLEGEESAMGITSYGDLNKAENSKISDDEITKRLEGKDVNVPHAEDIVMLEADHVQDAKMAKSDDSKLAESGDVRLVEDNDTKTPQVEETKDKDETMAKCEDVEMPEVNHMQDLLESPPAQSDNKKTLETRDVKLEKLDEVNLPKVEKTKDKEEVNGGSRERNVEVLDNESARTAEGISKSQDDKISESEHLKAEKSPETVDKETTEIMEEDVKTPATEGTTEKRKVKEGGVGEKRMKGKDEETSVEARISKKRRSRGQGSEKKDDVKEKKDTGRKEKEAIGSPGPSSSERPVRERKVVERLVEVLEKEQEQAKRFRIDKGCGTQLKDIPNVARKIARKKPADLKFLHQTLFGRVGKAGDYKNHILQFSGFTWHETEEKERTKIKEKLDKCVKDTLLDLCNLFNISVSRATVRKEELVAMLLDFMAAPHPISHDHDPDKDQQSAKSRKRKRVDNSAKQSKKYAKTEGTRKTEYDSDFESDEDEEEGSKEKGISSEDEERDHSENDTQKFASQAEAESDEDFSQKSNEKSKVSSKSKRVAKAEKSMVSSPKKVVARSTTKSPSNRSASHKNSETDNKRGRKVFSRVKKNTDSPKKSTLSKPDHKEKATGKRVATSRPGSKNTKDSRPSDGDLRKTMRDILSEVDFNTATFTDIFKQLGSHYKADLTERKASIKLILQEELTKLAEEAEDSEDDDDGGSGEDEGRSTRKKRARV